MLYGIKLRYQSGLLAGQTYAVVRFPYLPKVFDDYAAANQYNNIYYPCTGKKQTVLSEIVLLRFACAAIEQFYHKQTGRYYAEAYLKLLAWEAVVQRELERQAEIKFNKQRGIVIPRSRMNLFPEENA